MTRDTEPSGTETSLTGDTETPAMRAVISKVWSRIALGVSIVGAVCVWNAEPLAPFFMVGAVLCSYGIFAAIRSRRPGAPLFGIPAISYLALATIAGVASICIAAWMANADFGRNLTELRAQVFGGTPPAQPSVFEQLSWVLAVVLALLAFAALVASALVKYRGNPKKADQGAGFFTSESE